MHTFYDRACAGHPLCAGHHQTGHQQEDASAPVVKPVHKPLWVSLSQFLFPEYRNMIPYSAEQPYHSSHAALLTDHPILSV